MVHSSKKQVLVFLLALVFAGCGGGSGNGVTVSGGDSSFAASQQKIVFAGDSAVGRGNWSAYFGIPIENRGTDGLESWQLVNTIEGIAASKADKLFISIGGNNILNRHEGVLVGDVDMIIAKIRAASPSTRIFIHSILPKKADFINSLVERYNDQIQAVCNTRGVHFISTYNLFKSSATDVDLKYYTADGIHLNEAGYQVWANTIRPLVLS